MTVQIRRYRKGDPENVAAWVRTMGSAPTVVVDPGSQGAVALFHGPSTWSAPWWSPSAWWRLQGADGAVDAARAVCRVFTPRVELMAVVESSYGGGRGNAGSDIVLARNGGIVIGALLAELGPGYLKVVLVPPSTWQTVLGLKHVVMANGKKRPPDRTERKRAAAARAAPLFGEAWNRMPAYLRDPLGDVVGMAAWWASVVRSTGPTSAMVGDRDG